MNHYTNLQSTQILWFWVCGTVAWTNPQNLNHTSYKGRLPNLLLSLLSIVCLLLLNCISLGITYFSYHHVLLKSHALLKLLFIFTIVFCLLSIFCVFVFAVLICDFELHSISFTSLLHWSVPFSILFSMLLLMKLSLRYSLRWSIE